MLATIRKRIRFIMVSRIATVNLKMTDVRNCKQKANSVAFSSTQRKEWSASNSRSERDNIRGLPVSGFFNKLRLKLHGSNAINFAINIVVTLNQTNALNLGANLNNQA